MIFRKSTIEDVSNILKIIKQAQENFKKLNIDQWQDGYPNRDTIENDISLDESYVLSKDDEVLATTALSFRPEPTYDKIYQGSWLSDNPYGVVHRLAVGLEHRSKGYSYLIFKEVEKVCLDKNIPSIRIDTHVDNIPMKNLIKKLDFSYCGIILLENGDERLAYEKILK